MAKFQLLNPVLRVVGQKYDEKGIPVGELNKNVVVICFHFSIFEPLETAGAVNAADNNWL